MLIWWNSDKNMMWSLGVYQISRSWVQNEWLILPSDMSVKTLKATKNTWTRTGRDICCVCNQQNLVFWGWKIEDEDRLGGAESMLIFEQEDKE